MKLALITDAWQPQVNGVVTTLVELVQRLKARGDAVVVIEPGLFRTRPCPGYAGIDLAVRPGPALNRMLDEEQPDAIHIATEGPLGWAARRYCLRHGLAFTTAFHTKFPEILNAAVKVPLWMGYALFRHFHRPSSGVMVPTRGVADMLATRGFQNLRYWTHGVDTDLFSFSSQASEYPPLGLLARPVQLFVGRVSYEKNIEAFLQLDTPGTKVVCGVGPIEGRLRERFPEVCWLGVLPRAELSRVYAAADVFVFPSRADTFGLVMLEAMATGTPVAAFPVDGPLEVLAEVPGQPCGGTMRINLAEAVQAALQIPRENARAHALRFDWNQAAQLFADFLVPARTDTAALKPAS
ncbi:glycosyltransferase family 4 protein [Ottowia thiooxydans]|uniref:Glycosyltransferase involved in cell wall biosynthesis n=1 Tax=Ottowia thiooxydans TaxID=219182 RepID=A0ABV2QH84_9BURK